MTQANTRQLAFEETTRWLSHLMKPGAVLELRVLKVGGRKNRTASGYFDDHQKLAEAAQRYSGQADGVYVTLNPVQPALLARAYNRVEDFADTTTGDLEVERRRWLPFDFDPKRPSGISSTDEEHEAALTKMHLAVAWLTQTFGWPKPVKGDSGNGGHANYRIDLPNDQASTVLVQKCLQAMAMVMDDDRIAVDTSVFNASRIWKVYGTLAGKGDHVPERPHRYAKLIDVPDPIEVVTQEQLEALAAMIPEPEADPHKRNGYSGKPFDLELWIQEHNLDVGTARDWNGGKRWIFNVCPWKPEHTDRSAFIVRLANGAIAAGCKHNSCQGQNWHSLREMVEGPREKRQGKDGGASTPKDTTPTGPFIERSDLATAEYAYSLYGGEIIYTPTHGWLRRTDTHWTTDQAEAHAQRRVNDALRQQAGEALATGQTDLLKRSIPDARNTRNVLYQFKSLATVSTADLDSVPYLLNTLSGVVDLRTGELATHDPSARFTYCVQTEYRLRAYVLTHPLYREKLTEWFSGDMETIGFVERALGYAITGETKEEIAIWIQGQRRSGKGTMLNTPLELLGSPLGMSLAVRALTNERNDPQGFAIAPLKPARFVVASESKRHQRLDDGLLKWLTGRDTIQVAHKGRDPFQMRPQFKLFVMSNHLPSFDAGDSAVMGRIKIVKMPNSYYGCEDKDLKAALLSKEQRELLLSLLVAQAGYYYRSGLPIPKAIEDRAEEVRRANSPTHAWMGEAVFSKSGNQELLDDWYQHYCGWCEEWGFKPQVKGWFARTLNESGYPTTTEVKREGEKLRRVTHVLNGELSA